MADALRLVNGIPRTVDIPTGTASTYEGIVTVVSGTPADDTEIQGPVSSGTNITLPASETYTDEELKVFINGNIGYLSSDYSYVGAGSRTQIQILRDLEIDDKIMFRKG